ncbi:hypothetical protein [Roseibium sp. TrichSKD4]|uniref:hypothetical protein n=1 Tax=Roseibium sp. TrichSKD4 TaxID=744980 RepID=UPI0003072F49|nr:hypothetical protein [Roseibium sp. TrichSKD4]
MNSITKGLLASVFLSLSTTAGSAETVGPGGEKATPTSAVMVNDEQLDAVRVKATPQLFCGMINPIS